jgi:membrane-bound lytic murein transglycosylase A
MIAQDTGSAIVGPARADLYFGAGAEAGQVSGRLRHNARFVILIPKSLDPVVRGRKMPVPEDRPSAKIARLFPQADPSKDPPKDRKNGANPTDASAVLRSKDAATAATPTKSGAPATAQPPAAAETSTTAVAKPVPLPEARPDIKPRRDVRRHRHHRHRHHRRVR